MAFQVSTATPSKIRITELVDPRLAQKPSIIETSEENNGTWTINNIWVPEKKRGRGIGSKLLNRMIEEISKQGGRVILVQPGADGSDTDRLIKFYTQHGFSMCEDNIMRQWVTR